MRFSRADRLTRKAEYDRVLRHRGLRVSHGVFVALAAPRLASRTSGLAAAARPRLGLIVGRRQLPRAVDRNAVKRLIRESFRAVRPSLPDLDVVIRVISGTAGHDARAELEVIWKRVGYATVPESFARAAAMRDAADREGHRP